MGVGVFVVGWWFEFYFWGLLAEQADGDVANGRVDQYTFWDIVGVPGNGSLLGGDIGFAVW